MTLAELEEKLSLMSRSSTCNVEPHEAREMLAAVRRVTEAEREACATVADEWGFRDGRRAGADEFASRGIAAAIRARGGR